MSTSPVITYRQLGPNNDPIWSSYVSNAAAVAQAIYTRLLLLEGEWWESTQEGTPLWQSILGVGGANNTQAISLLLQQRILGTPYVTGLTSVQASYIPSTRAFSFYAVVQTQFGQVVVTNYPTPPLQTIVEPTTLA
jgi:hypothetical protein